SKFLQRCVIAEKAVIPGRIFKIIHALLVSIVVDLNSINKFRRTALGHHQSNYTRTCSNIEDRIFILQLNPGTKQNTISANFHCTTVLFNGELFESEGFIHILKAPKFLNSKFQLK